LRGVAAARPRRSVDHQAPHARDRADHLDVIKADDYCAILFTLDDSICALAAIEVELVQLVEQRAPADAKLARGARTVGEI